MVSVKYLTYFQKVCETLNMNRAAEELYVSQPALSQAIKSLENDLDVTLFLRSNKGLVLTQDGERLLRHTRLILHQFSLIENLKEEEEKQMLSFCAFPCIVPSKALTRFTADPEFQESAVNFEECRVAQILESVSSSTFEIGIVQYNDSQAQTLLRKIRGMGLEFHKICNSCWTIAVGPGNPLYGRDFVTVGDLKSFRLIRPKDDMFSYLTSEIQFGDIAMDDLQNDYINSGVMTAAVLASTDRYMFAAPGYFPEGLSSIHVLPISDPPVMVQIGWVQKKDTTLTKEADHFLEILREEYASVMRFPGIL